MRYLGVRAGRGPETAGCLPTMSWCCWFLNYGVTWINLYSSGIYSRPSLFSKDSIHLQCPCILLLLFLLLCLWQYLISVESTQAEATMKLSQVRQSRKKEMWLIHLPSESEVKNYMFAPLSSGELIPLFGRKHGSCSRRQIFGVQNRFSSTWYQQSVPDLPNKHTGC